MVAPRDRKHLLVEKTPITSEYTPYRPNIRVPKPPSPDNRAGHGAQLRASFEAAVAEARARREAGVAMEGVTPALYVEFSGVAGVPLELNTLESMRAGIELVAVKRDVFDIAAGQKTFIEKATVLVPEGKVGHFLTRFDEYSKTDEKKKGERRHENMLDRVASLRLATLQALWTDDIVLFPEDTNQAIWWELWLRRSDGKELPRFITFAEQSGIMIGHRRLQFQDRIVMLVHGSAAQLSSSIDVLDDVAEVRAVTQPAGFFPSLEPHEEAEWVDDLLKRTVPPQPNAPAVCVLDTGVNGGHPLLAHSTTNGDHHACDPAWTAADHHGHGTEMAGLALYGNLTPILASQEAIHLQHCLESVKILPPPGFPATRPELYGAITAVATSLVEIASPDRTRCFSMAVGANADKDRGRPTSWSAAVDALAAGRSFDANQQGLVYLEEDTNHRGRLFVLSAGNVDPSLFSSAYLEVCDIELIDDPGQAWNALTVGAYTILDQINDPTFAGWLPLAPYGELSPWSSTSVSFESQWPNKPDVVAEGGNIAHQQQGAIETGVPDLQLLTTNFQPLTRLLTLSWATSAACAQVANIAAQIAATYPTFWPETIRGLIVHSAEWTSAMKAHLATGHPGGKSSLVRRYGFGIPSAVRALRSASDSLTLVAQSVIAPYEKGGMKDIHFHELPWPKEQLAQLADAGVKLKVTLSYFIEPNPSRRGWRKKHRYQSHGLRFRVIGPAESVEEFRKRLNSEELGEDESKPDTPQDTHWFLGPRIRERGSIHSDVWTGSALDLSERSVIAIYPVSGWWKDQPSRDRSRLGVEYTLIISIETTSEDVDIWTPVAQQLGVAIPEIVEIGVNE